MSEYDNELTGVLFRNDKRETDKHPNAKGSATIGGVEYWVSAWTNTSQKGEKYQSLKFQRKDERPQQSQQSPADRGFDDSTEIPF